MIRYGLTILISAFLLFQIQPLIARLILPTFGGTSAVWTTCMMFFQVTLLLGYLYAHLLRQLLSPTRAWIFHAIVLLTTGAVTAWLFRPTMFAYLTGPESSESILPSLSTGFSMTGSITIILACTIGLPFLVLSSTGPLIQAWQATTHDDRSPYRLYALSNAASLLALVSYPFLIEPWVSLDYQQTAWTIGFLAFCIFCFWSGRQSIAFDHWHQAGEGKVEPISWLARLGWIILPMTASIVLLATTNLMCQEVASIPFLWILPLTLYLVSFIVCFERPELYRRRPWMLLLGMGTVVSILLFHLDVNAGLTLQVAGLSGVCFFCSMVCHGELERSKPHVGDLTSFYLWVAAGGALGGVLVAVAAPLLFDGFYEFHFGLAISLLFALAAIYRCLMRDRQSRTDSDLPSPGQTGWNRLATIATGCVLLVGLAATACSLVYFLDPAYHQGLVFRGRNEYGLTTIVDRDGYRQFINGRVLHGGQNLDAKHRLEHNAYYVPGSGVAVAFDGYRWIQSQADNDNPAGLKVGVLGLGAGAMCTWLEEQDSIVFYEINPMVHQVAQEHFSYLDAAPGHKEVLLGDGRVLMQQDLDRCQPREFDLLFMDAFASDSIPVHLLTEESIGVYLDELDPQGTLVFHISNHFIDLLPVLLQHAETYQLTPLLIDTSSGDQRGTSWVMLTRNSRFIDAPMVRSAICPLPEHVQLVRWTDDYSSVAAQLKWSARVDWDAVGQQAVSETDQSDKVKESQP